MRVQFLVNFCIAHTFLHVDVPIFTAPLLKEFSFPLGSLCISQFLEPFCSVDLRVCPPARPPACVLWCAGVPGSRSRASSSFIVLLNIWKHSARGFIRRAPAVLMGLCWACDESVCLSFRLFPPGLWSAPGVLSIQTLNSACKMYPASCVLVLVYKVLLNFYFSFYLLLVHAPTVYFYVLCILWPC